ncbi:SusC/RagA family TonB-linked outer membrane protein [Leptobacterium flavescens]|uniref:SusC/RagA family TonB-linked outer membrane protein n=1 Tax=Leptobacterium flavescens TaxID=472055 RepID=A0A6P0UMR9_9FLAO|nr:TonB-dependent receptor [Leptobacterium flavescens]NER13872.1 SusC/RagA family TonB-linked outer membrane protein [Leptobacterium flavescens]
MKIYAVLLCISIAKLFADNTYAQNISLKMRNVELKTIFTEIEKKSEYSFFYNNSLVDVSKKKSLNVENKEVLDVLSTLLKNTEIDYKIFKKQIILFPKNNVSIGNLLKELLEKNEQTVNSDANDVGDANLENVEAIFEDAVQDLVSGNVSDNNGTPLIGVSVVIKGTTTGTQTDFDGNYQIDAKQGDILVFSYIGMQTTEITVGTSKTINVTMQESVNSLEEVIVVAYGTAKKGDFTGSATKIDAKTIEKRTLTNVANVLDGASAGVRVTPASGQPGSGPAIRVRGIGSVNASSAPLIVLDGVQFDGNISSLNANDIESFTVLKDAASTSLYGARAANGVVIITTKRGRSGQADQFSLNVSQGITSRSIPEYDRVNASQYYPLMWEALRNSLSISGNTPIDQANQLATDGIFDELLTNPFNVPNDQIVGTDGLLNPNAQLLYPDDLDWQEPLIRSGSRSNIDFSYRGASQTTDYFVSLSYLNEKGFLINTDFERITGRINVNTKLNDWFKTGLNLSYANSVSNQQTAATNAFVNPFFSARAVAPIYPVFLHDPVTGEFILDDNGDRIFDPGANRVGGTSGRHVVQETMLNVDRDEINTISARTYAEFHFLKDFTFTFNATLDKRFFRNEDLNNRITGDGAPDGNASRTSNLFTSITYNQLLNYTRDFDKHSISVLLGHESYRTEREFLTGTRTQQVADGNTELDNFVTTTNLSSQTDEQSTEGYFSRFSYDYDDKYYLSGSYRRDGSSRFDPDVRWGNFFSVGGAWRLDRENFMADLPWVNALKLRASYGEVGNDNLGFFVSQELFSLGFNNEANPGILSASSGNPNLKWEVNVQTDVAVEYGLFNNRISGTIEYYNRESKDLLFNVPLPREAGLDNIPSNIGSMENRGFEFDISADIITKPDFKWNLNLNAATIENEITELPQEEIITGTKKLVVGGDIFAFFLREWAGVDPADGSGLFILDPELGAVGDSDVRTVDGQVVTTNQNKALRSFVGTSLPDVFGSFTNTFTYKGFELSFLFTYQLGGLTLDNNYGALIHSGTYGNSLHTDILDRWQQPGDITDIPRLDADQVNTFGAQSTRFFIKSDFLALRQASISYTFRNDSFTESLGLNSARIYATGENIFIASGRSGFDAGQNFNGTTQNRFTPSRVIAFGVNVTF